MKHSTRFSLLLAGAIAVLPITGLLAQEPAAAPTPSVSAPSGPDASTTTPPEGGKKEHMKAKLASLTPEERQEFMEAHRKAMSDPAVQAAKADKGDKKAFHKAMHDAMLKADPNIEPILAKLHGKVKKKDLQAS